MEAVDNYPSDLVTAFAPSVSFLRRGNIRFFTDDESKFSKYWKFFLIIPSIALFYTTSVIHACDLLSQKQIFLVAYLLPPILVSTQAILKACVVIPQMAQITGMLKELGELWKTKGITKKQNYKKTELLKKINFCNSLLHWVSIIGTFQYLISPLVETLVRKFILMEECEFLLPIYGSYPLNATNNWISYLLIYIIQFTCVYICVFIYVGAELFPITFCAMLGIEFALLREDLLQLKPENKCDTLAEHRNEEYTITDFVKSHQRLIELGRQLDEIFNPIVFIDLFFVGITTCFFRYAGQFARGPTYMANNYVAVCSSLTFVLYLCYSGELLMAESIGIGNTAYEIQWYKGDKYFQKTIWFVIKRSQKPCCLTSLKYATITLNMFTKVMSTTWSYFSLMNTVYGEEN
ncbi:odorant receptor 13a [Manduca sexta]|uniref:odorant receptor 13a n=1 Tax=Manduca sexta TaxID=7130 RepID=UPI00188E8C87|nr:odorant receptor 13a [Manduca sexta]